MDASDAFWLVWVSGRRKLVYPCKVVEMKSATGNGAVTMMIHSYQDNGFTEEEVTLRAKARYDESQIRAPSRQHLDWAVRTKALPGEADFKVSLLATSGDSAGTDTKQANDPAPATKRGKQNRKPQEETLEQRLTICEQRVANNSEATTGLAAEVAELRGKFDAWDGTVKRMQDYMRQQGMLAEEVRMLKQAAAPGAGGCTAQADEAGPSGQADAEGTTSDPVCCTCKKNVAYDMPMRGLLEGLKGDTGLKLSDLFSPSGAVKAKSPLKKLVQCGQRSPKDGRVHERRRR